MNISRHLISSAIALATSAVIGLSAVHAANYTPSVEITGGPGQGHLCDGGSFQIPIVRKINGFGSTHMQAYPTNINNVTGVEHDFTDIYENQVASMYQVNMPMGLALPANAEIIVEFYTFDQPKQQGNWTYFSRVGFNCSTGAVNFIQNEAFVEEDKAPWDVRIEVPVDGPAFEHPGDIRSVGDPGEIRLQDLKLDLEVVAP